MSSGISDRVPAKNRAGMAALCSFAQNIIEARQHNVVLVQDMHPVTSRPLNASIPRIRQTSVFGFAMERHPPRANSAGNFRSSVIIRAIVDYLDLHLGRSGVLFEYA